jgi:hypothetical protein
MAVLIATPGGAGAATTIGQLAPPNPPAFCTLGPFDVVQPTVTSGNSYVVPSNGVLTSWSHNAAAGAGQTLTMKVFRKVADPNTYQVIGHDGPRPLDASALNTFPASIPVKPGDLLGVNDANASDANNACLFITGAGDLHRELEGDLADGASDDFDVSGPTDTRINATASVEPDCDRDGLGDETQDTNLSACAPSAAAPTGQRAAAKKKCKKKFRGKANAKKRKKCIKKAKRLPV